LQVKVKKTKKGNSATRRISIICSRSRGPSDKTAVGGKDDVGDQAFDQGVGEKGLDKTSAQRNRSSHKVGCKWVINGTVQANGECVLRMKAAKLEHNHDLTFLAFEVWLKVHKNV
jgi:hypothetical protein